MSDIVLKVENLHKRYRLGVVNQAAFVDDVRIAWAKLQGKPDPTERYITANELANKSQDELKKEKPKYVWALQDINFEVKRGEVLGIIGKNGAGKSTLLKILSKTTAPTRGQVKVKGRVASLLEVGTGFHPELTGRENIYLNGLILGMKRHEITAKLDEIVDFAGVENYLDTPTKRYSSGMKVRLGFAVAAHLEPDILVVDEVLAVGDAEFQKKAIGKMQEVSKGDNGRTVLFVSHNMNSVRSLCTRGIFLKDGKLFKEGRASYVVEKYLLNNINLSGNYVNGVNEDLLQNTKWEHGLVINSIKIVNLSRSSDFIYSSDTIKIAINFSTSRKFRNPAFVVQLKGKNDFELLRISSMPISGYSIDELQIGRYQVSLTIESLPIIEGDYYIDVGFVQERVKWFFKLENIIQLKIRGLDVYNSGFEVSDGKGAIWNKHSWDLVKI